jgi:hypothetical protein
VQTSVLVKFDLTCEKEQNLQKRNKNLQNRNKTYKTETKPTKKKKETQLCT